EALTVAGDHDWLGPLARPLGGYVTRSVSGTVMAAFPRVRDALAAAMAAHESRTEASSVRMALHTGDVEEKDGQYHGSGPRPATRLLAAAHPGQILLSEAPAGLLQSDLPPGVEFLDLGLYRLPGQSAPERLFQVLCRELARREFPPLNAAPAHSGH